MEGKEFSFPAWERGNGQSIRRIDSQSSEGMDTGKNISRVQNMRTRYLLVKAA